MQTGFGTCEESEWNIAIALAIASLYKLKDTHDENQTIPKLTKKHSKIGDTSDDVYFSRSVQLLNNIIFNIFIRKTPEMEDINCPVCLEIPPGEIYQCENGHTVCGSCSTSLETCPECREPYGSRKIRNRALERILDNQTFDCIFKEKGCNQKLKRQDISKHGDCCSFNSELTQICKELGFTTCEHALNSSNISGVIKHFEMEHGAASQQGNRVLAWHTDFSSAISSPKNSKWCPILLTPEEGKPPLFMILGKVDIRRDTVTWAALQLGKTRDDYEVEIGFLSIGAVKLPRYRWTMPVDVASFGKNSITPFGRNEIYMIPIQIPLWVFRMICNASGNKDIPISFLIQVRDEEKDRARPQEEPPAVWVFSSEMKIPQVNTQEAAGTPSHNGRCDQCRQNPLRGNRYKCFQCVDYDLCETCVGRGYHSHHIFMVLRTMQQSTMILHSFTRIRSQGNCGINLPSGEDTKFDGVACDECKKTPICKKQFKCLQCDDYNLCENCFKRGSHSFHIFAVLTTQLQRKLFMGSFEQVRV